MQKTLNIYRVLHNTISKTTEENDVHVIIMTEITICTSLLLAIHLTSNTLVAYWL